MLPRDGGSCPRSQHCTGLLGNHDDRHVVLGPETKSYALAARSADGSITGGDAYTVPGDESRYHEPNSASSTRDEYMNVLARLCMHITAQDILRGKGKKYAGHIAEAGISVEFLCISAYCKGSSLLHGESNGI